MSSIAPAPLLTTADLPAMPDNGKERWLILGRLWDKPATKRTRFHASTEARVIHLIGNWLDGRPEQRGSVYSGGVGCILQHDPSTTVGIDVAYFLAEVVNKQTSDTTLVDGVPTLAVEILSPSDTTEEIDEKVVAYLSAGVALVWVINPRMRTVQVNRPDAEPVLFNVTQELSAEPHLPGFQVSVAKLFTR